ncbi:hypothetical protein Nmel_001823 [Mimus melanotis]
MGPRAFPIPGRGRGILPRGRWAEGSGIGAGRAPAPTRRDKGGGRGARCPRGGRGAGRQGRRGGRSAPGPPARPALRSARPRAAPFSAVTALAVPEPRQRSARGGGGRPAWGCRRPAVLPRQPAGPGD